MKKWDFNSSEPSLTLAQTKVSSGNSTALTSQCPLIFPRSGETDNAVTTTGESDVAARGDLSGIGAPHQITSNPTTLGARKMQKARSESVLASDRQTANAEPQLYSTKFPFGDVDASCVTLQHSRSTWWPAGPSAGDDTDSSGQLPAPGVPLRPHRR